MHKGRKRMPILEDTAHTRFSKREVFCVSQVPMGVFRTEKPKGLHQSLKHMWPQFPLLEMKTCIPALQNSGGGGCRGLWVNARRWRALLPVCLSAPPNSPSAPHPALPSAHPGQGSLFATPCAVGWVAASDGTSCVLLKGRQGNASR